MSTDTDAPAAAGQCPSCGAIQPLPAGDKCAYCRLPLAPSPDPRLQGLVLAFPFGDVSPTEGQTVALGRAVGPFATCLDPYDTVSRHHANLSLEQGRLAITDVGSTNGTFVQGRRLQAQQACVLQAGDVVGLSSTCVAQVEER